MGSKDISINQIILSGISASDLCKMLADVISIEFERKTLSVPSPSDVDEPLSRKQAAQMLKVSLSTLNALMKRGEVPFHRLGRRILFFKMELLVFVKKSSSDAVAPISSNEFKTV